MHGRHRPPWRQPARRPLTAAVLVGGVLTIAITVAGLAGGLILVTAAGIRLRRSRAVARHAR